VAQAPLWGLGRGIGLERPDLFGGLIDLERGAGPEAAPLLADAIEGAGAEDHLAIRGGARYAARLVRAPEIGGGEAEGWAARGTCLITGGLGDIGLRLGRWLVERGARHLVLVGRTGAPDRGGAEPDPGTRAGARAIALREIERLGATWEVHEADVADPDRMAEVLASIDPAAPPLRVVVHAAGVSDPALLEDLDLDRFHRTVRPKVLGLWNLHRLTRDLPLDAFVAFSSISSVWGSSFLAHYAAGNHFLDVMARHRRALGLPALTVAWGAWGNPRKIGMLTTEEGRMLAEMGISTMPPAALIESIGCLLEGSIAWRVIAAVDWARFKPVFEARRRRPLLDRIEVGGAAGPAAADADLLRSIAEAAPADRLPIVARHVRRHVGHVLGHDASSPPDLDRGFFEMGMDSLLSLKLRDRLQSSLGIAMPATAVFEHPSVRALAEHLLGELPLPAAEPPLEPTAAEADDLGDLPEAELAAILSEELSRLEGRRP
jgi:myxalamid-type polyketide synthase MxaE and MxaD